MSVILDFTVYNIAYNFGFDLNFSKALGYLVGAFFSYYLNRRWTFGYKGKKIESLVKFFSLYTVSLIINVLVNKVILYLFASFEEKVFFAFLLATSLSVIINFLGMRKIVFIKINDHG